MIPKLCRHAVTVVPRTSHPEYPFLKPSYVDSRRPSLLERPADEFLRDCRNYL